MVKNNYIQVIDDIYIYIRDNAVGGIFNYYFRAGSRAIRKSTGTSNINDAKRKAIYAYEEYRLNPNKAVIAAAVAAAPAAMTTSFKMVAEKWLERRKSKSDYKRNYATVMNYLIPHFDGKLKMKDIRSLTQTHIDEYLEERKAYWVTGAGASLTQTYLRKGRKVVTKNKPKGELCENTRNRESTPLRQIIQLAKKDGLIDANAQLDVEWLKSESEPRPDFSLRQADKICRLAKERMLIGNLSFQRDRTMLCAYIHLLRHTGMRPGELISLEWRDVDLTNRLLIIRGRRGGRKTGSRVVPLLYNEPITVLKEMQNRRIAELNGASINENDPIFIKKNGTQVDSFKTSFNTLLKACEFEHPSGKHDYSQYSFRHTYVTQIAKLGLPTQLLSKVLGTSLEMINAHYDHNSAIEALAWMDAYTKTAKAPAVVTGGDTSLRLHQQPDHTVDLVIKDGGLTFK